jgi:hypothetical protein
MKISINMSLIRPNKKKSRRRQVPVVVLSPKLLTINELENCMTTTEHYYVSPTPTLGSNLLLGRWANNRKMRGYESDDEAEDTALKPRVDVEVPSWRVKEFRPMSKRHCRNFVSSEDTSIVAVEKRHRRHEYNERQIKRRDLQRRKQESYILR